MSVEEYYDHIKRPRLTPVDENDEHVKEMNKLMAKAKSNIWWMLPFFAQLLADTPVTITKDERLQTIMTDLRHMFISYSWLKNQMETNKKSEVINTVETALLHQIFHMIFQHHERFTDDAHDMDTWKEACEITVNFAMEETKKLQNAENTVAKWDLPTDLEDYRQYMGQTADQVYLNLINNRPPPESSTTSCNCDIEQFAEIAQNDSIGATNWEELLERDVNTNNGKVRNAIAKAGIGNLPGNIHEQIESDLDPQIPWQSVLMGYVTPMIPSDFDTKPNKKFLPYNFIIPSVKKTGMNVLIAVDTSVSVTWTELQQFISEVISLLSMVQNLELTIVDIDTNIRQVRKLTSTDPPEDYATFKGRGGTSFQPLFATEEGKKIIEESDPAVILYYTDGESWDYPTEDQVNHPLIWLITREKSLTQYPANCGESIFLDVDQ